MFPQSFYGAKPKEYMRSVDLCLILLQQLNSAGEVKISEVAREYGVSQSTVHRSLAMLVYRGFAVPTIAHTYLAGPALNTSTLTPRLGTQLSKIARPYLQLMTAATGETTHLTITRGRKTHFIDTVDGIKAVRVGSRKGQVVPAENNSGGLACLAELSSHEQRELYKDWTLEDFKQLRRKLRRVRERGFSVNNQMAEKDVSAVGAALINDMGDVLGAVTISMPSIRFSEMSALASETLQTYATELNRQLADFIHPTSPITTPTQG